MGRAALCMRAAALLAAAGMLIFLAEGISADNDIAEAVAARVLEPTELVAEIPEGYGTLFQIQWGGGGRLSQLRGRLAGRGCALNTLWVYSEDGWHGYNRFDLPREFPINRQFIERYEQDVPAGTLYATCADQPVAQDLQPTQIVADIPEEYDTMFELQWGGGSLYQLKGRLATMGCMVNNISFTSPETNTQYTYNQYTTRSTNPTNQQFLKKYEQLIPVNVLYADCYDVCELREDKKCILWEEMRDLGDLNYADIVYPTGGLPCTADFHPKVMSNVFNVLPVAPDLCIIRREDYNYAQIGGQAIAGDQSIPPFILIFKHSNHIEVELLHTEIHEICHINQYWHWLQQLKLDSQARYNSSRYFNNSSHGQEFIDLIGFKQFDSPDWKLPVDNVYRDVYSLIPVELAAELCSMHLLDKMGERGTYDYQTYSDGRYIMLPEKRDFDASKYLTPEIVEWLETYMILPEIAD